MAFPIFESYEGELIKELQTLAYEELCGTAGNSYDAQVNLATPPATDMHYISCVYSNGDVQPFEGSISWLHQPPTAFYSEATGSSWLIPDPDDTPKDREFWTLGGTKITYRYYLTDQNTENPKLNFGIKYFHIRHEGEYKQVTHGVNQWFGFISLPYDQIKQIYLSVYYLDMIRFKDPNNNWEVTTKKGYGFLISGRTTTGSTISPSTLFLVDDTIFTLSDGSDDVKPDIERNTTKPGGFGYGGMSGANPAFHLNLNDVNALGTWGSTTGFGLTYYKIQENTLHDILKWIYSWGVANDNSYLRSSIVCAQKVPGVVNTNLNPIDVRIADQTNTFGSSIKALTISQRVSKMPEMRKVYTAQDGNGDAADFEQMEIMLHLPFVGTVNLDPKICFGNGTVFYIEGFTDAYTGNVVYFAYTKTAEKKSNEILYGIYSGCGALTLPIVGGGAVGTQIDYVKNRNNSIPRGLQNVINTATDVATNLASGNVPGAVSAGIKGYYEHQNNELDIMKLQHPQVTVDKSGVVDPSGALTENRAVSLTFSIPVKVLPQNYAEENGKPCFKYVKVRDLTAGFHQFSALMIDKISDASESEKDAIRAILMKGVYKK